MASIVSISIQEWGFAQRNVSTVPSTETVVERSMPAEE
jgi:hypothetical protein